MAKPNLQQLLNSAKDEPSASSRAPKTVNAAIANEDSAPAVRQVHKPGEVNISAYFPPEVKAALRMAQAKTGKNVKQCLAEALQDFFRKHNVPVSIPLEELRS
jgi:hypothetical protein